jgi:hypothetical protein
VLWIQAGPYSYAKIRTQALILLTTQVGSSKLLKFNMRFYIKLAKYARVLLRVNTKLYHSICIFYCPFFAIKCVKRFDMYIYATFFTIVRCEVVLVEQIEL